MLRTRPWRGHPRRILGRLRAEEGFSLVELTASLSLLAVGFFALAGAASTGARLLAEARQRQSASEIASRQIEHMRNIPFDQVALTSTLTPSSDPIDPDYYVSTDGTAFDHTSGEGSYETLVVDTSGQVAHTEEVTVGATLLTVYSYVTWVDDPGVAGTEDYKRLTVVAAYRAPVNTGRPRNVRASTLFTTGTVIVGGDASSPTPGSSGSPTPTPSPTPSGSCSGDTTGPTGSFTILSGTGASTGFTASTTVTISMAPSDPCSPITVAFSNDNTTFGSPVTYDPVNPTATWTIADGDGAKSVWARFTDGVGNQRTVGPESITLDQTDPTVPGTLSASLSCTGADRTATLSWSTSTDTNLLGYRVYRSVDGGAYQVVATTNGLSATNTHKKNLDSVRFYVVAYDKAGNEGGATNVVALSKNQCS